MKGTLALSGLAALVVLPVGPVAGHGAMTYPTPRNAIDGALPAFKSWGFPCDASHKGVDCSHTFCDGNNTGDRGCQGSCPKSAHNGDVNALTADNGLSCYWYSIGCTVGCEECDMLTNHPNSGGQMFLYKGLKY